MQTVVETAAFLSDARSLGLPDAERLAIVTWIAANPAAGKPIEGTGGARKVRFAGKARERVAATGLSHSLPGRTSRFSYSTSLRRTRKPIWRRKSGVF